MIDSLWLSCLLCLCLQLHQHEFALNAAIYQLYLYADKYYETVSVGVGWLYSLW